ncbi:MAG: cytochrome c [Pirellulales bacterium]|nr:cytochrome c [Pirellulales bacterium]
MFASSRVVNRLILAGLLLVAVGCTAEPPAQFRLNREGQDRSDTETYTPAKLQHVVDCLTALFGTPDEPFAFEETALDMAKVRRAAGPDRREPDGRFGGLFRRHCSHCHGITGDGFGESARLLNPYPRDFRRGVFKYTSTLAGQKPTDQDLLAVLSAGIPGTGMPSFGTLPTADLEALVEYVKFLALRGECEILIQDYVFTQDETLDHDLLVDEVLVPMADGWQAARDEANWIVPTEPQPSDTSASIAAGRELFRSESVGCTKCHGPQGRGDTPQKNYDIWNDAKKDLSPQHIAERFNLPLQEIRPRNLQQAVYHGGGSPIDLYRRIYAGIKGTPMPALGPSPGTDLSSLPPDSKLLTPTQIWNLVDFVLSLPQETTVATAAP